MALVDLTAAQRLEVKESATFSNECKEKIFEKIAYFCGINSGDVTWAKNRAFAASVIANPDILHTRNREIADFFMHNMLIRDMDKYDDSNPDYIAGVIAHLKNNNNFDFLVDDFFAEKTKHIPF